MLTSVIAKLAIALRATVGAIAFLVTLRINVTGSTHLDSALTVTFCTTSLVGSYMWVILGWAACFEHPVFTSHNRRVQGSMVCRNSREARLLVN